MKYLGYHETSALPFRKGELVRIPKGVMIHTMHPGRTASMSSRTRTITVHHLMNGQSIRIDGMSDSERGAYPQFNDLYDEYDRRYANLCVHVNQDLAKSEYKALREMQINISNPRVCWAGQGGYWNETEINGLLEANGKL